MFLRVLALALLVPAIASAQGPPQCLAQQVGRTTFLIHGMAHGDITVGHCLPNATAGFPPQAVPMYDSGSLSSFSCATSTAVRTSAEAFPTGPVTVTHLACSLEGTSLTTGQSITFGVRWRNLVTQTEQTDNGSQVTLTVGATPATPVFGSVVANAVCPYATCGLAINVEAKTLTAGTAIGASCTAFTAF